MQQTNPANETNSNDGRDHAVVTTHELEVWPDEFERCAKLKQSFLIRQKFDCEVGDFIRANEFDPLGSEDGVLTGEYLVGAITCIVGSEPNGGYMTIGIDFTSGSPEYPLCITYSTIKGASMKPGSKEVELYFDSNESANELLENIRMRWFAESM